jgi:methyltransferase (TIGR00027 family)
VQLGGRTGTLLVMDTTTGSRTARAVAVGRAVGVAGHRDPHVAALLPAGDRLAIAATRPLAAAAAALSTPVPAAAVHAALRMLAVDRAVDHAVRRSAAHQLVIVGAGYDTRAWRLAALRRRHVVEVDHPATQAAKCARLDRAGLSTAAVTFLGADLARDDLDAGLGRAGHDPTRPTVWLWEAVVPYLAAGAVDATLRVLQRRSVPDSRLLVTTVTPALLQPRALGRLLAAPARAAMHTLGEPVLLAESDAAVAGRLARHGFDVDDVTGPARWAAAAGVAVRGPTLDERLHVATVAS